MAVPSGRESGDVDASCVGKEDKVPVPGVTVNEVHGPSSLREAQQSPPWEYWSQAMQEDVVTCDTFAI